jgi:hypothetical protein
MGEGEGEARGVFFNWQLETNWNGVDENSCAFVKSGTRSLVFVGTTVLTFLR